MALDNLLSRMGLDTKQLTERYAEYTGPMQDQPLFYAYEPSSPPHGHGLSTKHHYSSGGHKGNAAMSALTLLAFLFFLHILQQCLKDHMTAIGTPQVMIMTAGKEGEGNVAKLLHKSKVDKSGVIRDENDFQTEILNSKHLSDDARELEIQNSNVRPSKTLIEIKTAEHNPQIGAQKYMKNHGNRSSMFANFYDEHV